MNKVKITNCNASSRQQPRTAGFQLSAAPDVNGPAARTISRFPIQKPRGPFLKKYGRGCFIRACADAAPGPNRHHHLLHAPTSWRRPDPAKLGDSSISASTCGSSIPPVEFFSVALWASKSCPAGCRAPLSPNDFALIGLTGSHTKPQLTRNHLTSRIFSTGPRRVSKNKLITTRLRTLMFTLTDIPDCSGISLPRTSRVCLASEIFAGKL